ncbi:MAG: hypothetical protein RLZZ306_725 [Bacteroidota bacterium]|jgi:polyhydroxyalkanoate synthesis regulator phasin
MKEQLEKLRQVIYNMIQLSEGNDEIVDSLLERLNDLNEQIKKLENKDKK